MQVAPVFSQFKHIQPSASFPRLPEECELVDSFCKSFELPDEKSNHARFDEKMAAKIVSYKEKAVEPVIYELEHTEDEKYITAGLFLLNRLIDAGTKGIENEYHVISRFNYNKSPNVQVMLAGIYRKTQIPDGFGPLMTMFMHNAQNPVTKPFDPNEEVGGAILEYLRNKAARNAYK